MIQLFNCFSSLNEESILYRNESVLMRLNGLELYFTFQKISNETKETHLYTFPVE